MTFPELPSLTVAHWYYNTTNNDGKRTQRNWKFLGRVFWIFLSFKIQRLLLT